jgi:hypothetical protein
MADQHERHIRGEIWKEIERLVTDAKADGRRLDDSQIAAEIMARFPHSGLTQGTVRQELRRFGDAIDER